MSDLSKTNRDAIVSSVIKTVEMKHFDPHLTRSDGGPQLTAIALAWSKRRASPILRPS